MFHHASHITVEPGDHRGLSLVRIRPVLARVWPVIGHVRSIAERTSPFIVRVRNNHAPIQKERSLLVLAHKPKRIIRKKVVGKLLRLRRVARTTFANRRDNIWQRDALLVAPQKIRKMVMRVMLVEVAEKVSKALFARQPALRLAHIAKAPLTNQRGFISRLFQNRRHRDIALLERLGSRIRLSRISTNPCMSMMLARHQDASRRGTNSGSGVVLREAHAFTGHAIEIRCLDHFLSVATELRITEIIGHDPNQIRLIHRVDGWQKQGD